MQHMIRLCLPYGGEFSGPVNKLLDRLNDTLYEADEAEDEDLGDSV